MKRPTPARLAARSSCSEPVAFTWWFSSGSWSEWRTPRQARWKTASGRGSTARRHVAASVTSPSITRSRPVRAAPSRFARLPFRKLSRTVTLQPEATRTSTRCEPMNPAPPVTSTWASGWRIFNLPVPEFPDHRGDVLDLRIGQFRVHRQAEPTLGCPLRYGKVARLPAQLREALLEVDRHRVVERGPHAPGLEVVAQPVPRGVPHDVEVVHAL